MLPLRVLFRALVFLLGSLLAMPALAQDRADARTARTLAAVEGRVSREDVRGALRLLRRALRRDADVRLAARLCELSQPDGLSREEATECRAALERGTAEPSFSSRTDAERAHVDALLLDTLLVLEGPLSALEDAMHRMRPQSEALATELRTIAAAAVRAHDLPTAEHALDRARETLPQSVEVLSDLGLVLLAQGRAAEAVAVLASAVSRRPGDLSLVRDLAGAHMAAGDPSRAAVLLVETLRDGDLAAVDAAPLELDAARAFLDLGEHALALDHAERASLLAPSDAEPWVLASRAHLASGDAEAARAAIDEALRRDPESASARRASDALAP